MKKNNPQYSYTRIQRYYGVWLKLFFSICLINSVVLFFHQSPEDYLKFSMLLPFIHLGIVWGILIIYSVFSWARLYDDPNSMYIKEKYPKIWKKLHPWGDFSVNHFAGIQFVRGKYDDGTDQRLNQIKFTSRMSTKLMLGTFFLVPVIWFCNIAAFMISEILKTA